MRSRAIMIVNVQDRQSRGGVGARRRLGGALGWWGPKRKPASLYYPRMRVREEKRACFWPPPHHPPTPSHHPFPLPILVVQVHYRARRAWRGAPGAIDRATTNKRRFLYSK